MDLRGTKSTLGGADSVRSRRASATLRPLAAVAACAFAFVGWSIVSAQNGAPASAAPDAPYEGVAPGSSNTPPLHAAVRRSQARAEPKAILSWVGFTPRPDGGSRFFLQLSRSVTYSTAASPGRFEVLLPNARVHLRNTRRPIDTRYFDTPVRSARVERRGRADLAVVFVLRAEATPTLSAAEGANGYHFVYLDFAPGNYAPPPGPVPTPGVTPSQGSGDATGGPPSRFETEEPGYDPEEPGTNIRVYQGGN